MLGPAHACGEVSYLICACNQSPVQPLDEPRAAFIVSVGNEAGVCSFVVIAGVSPYVPSVFEQWLPIDVCIYVCMEL